MAVPIVLHLIAKREPRKVVIPSIRFLTKRFESNRSRLQVRRWWLLALRIAAIALFALALAQPAIDRSLSVTWLTIGLVTAGGVAALILASVALARGQSRSTIYSLATAGIAAFIVAALWGGYTYASGPSARLDNTAPVSIAIVLDNAPTSAWRSGDDDRINRMQDLATWMIARLPPTSRIAIVDRSSQPAIFSLDAASALAKVERLRPLEVTQPIDAKIDAAIRLVRTSELESRHLFLVTDLAAATWRDAVSEQGLASLMDQDPSVSLTLFDLGTFDKPNRSLSIPKLADATPPQGVPVPLSTTVELSAGDGPSSLSITAELQLYQNDPALPVVRDGNVTRPTLRSVDRTSVRVAAGGRSELLLTIPPLDVGTHHGLIRLTGDDALGLDDQRYFTLRVLPPTTILLVCDDEDEARVISLAMSDEFVVERIDAADLPVVRLEDYPATMIIDPPSSLLADELLAEYVSGGGNLFVCLGPSCDVTPPVTTPVSVTSPIPTLIRRWRSPLPGTFLDVVAPAHPLLSPFSEITPAPAWSDFRIQQHWQVGATADDSVLMRYAGTDHPALTERILKNDNDAIGRVLTLTTPLPALAPGTRQWNELFSASEPWPAFLLVRQIAEHLTDRGSSQSMSRVGQPQVVRLSDDLSTSEPRRVQLFSPGDVAPVPLNVPQGSDRVVVTEVARSGTYWLRGAGNFAGFSANLPDDATQLQRIERSDLDKVFGPDTYRFAKDREEVEVAESDSKNRVLLHSPAMLLALIVFLLEQVLGNRFYRSPARENVSTRSGAAV